VVLSHVAAAPVGSGQWLSALFWAGLTHASVPPLLPPERELSVKKLKRRKGAKPLVRSAVTLEKWFYHFSSYFDYRSAPLLRGGMFDSLIN